MGSTKTIYVVDDSDVILTQARDLLRGHFRVRTFSSAAALLKVANSVGEPPDLLLIDIEMPVVGGAETLEKTRQLPGWEDIPVMLITSWDTDAVLEHFFSQGVLDVINKPIVPSIIIARINNYFKLIDYMRQSPQ